MNTYYYYEGIEILEFMETQGSLFLVRINYNA